MKQNVYNQPYNHHHHHQSNSTASSNNSNPSVNPPNYSSALKNNNNSNNNTNNSSGPRGGPTQQNKPQHTGYNNHRGSGGGGANQANQNSHGPSMNYTGGYQQSGNTGANPAGGPAPPPGHFDNQQYNYSQQAQYGGGKQQGQQFNQQGFNKPSATSENGPYYNKAAQHKQIHVTPPPNLVQQQQQQQQHSQPHPQQQPPSASVSEPTPALTKQTSIEEPSTVKVVTPASIVVASSTAEITEKMSSMKIESKQPQVVEGEKKIDEPMNEPETSISPDIQQQQQQPTVIISQDQEFEPSRLCEVTGSCENGADNSEYYRNLVVAVDRLYPESKFPLHDTWTFGYIKNDPSAARWEMNIKEIIDISYVEDFWSVVSHCPTASQLFNLGDLTFFKKGIRPMWEDAENKQGGSWLHQVSGNAGGGSFANKRPSAMEVDDFWIETLLALIGDNFCANNHLVTGDSTTSSSDTHICGNISGLFLSHRGKGWKLALWTKNYRDEKTTRLIGKMWKHLLKLNDNHTITFEAHESKNNKNASNKIVYKE